MSKRRRASAKRARSSGDAEEVLEQSESEGDDVGCEPGIKDIDSESSGCSVDTDIDSGLESAIERQAVVVASELQKKTRQLSALSLEKAASVIFSLLPLGSATVGRELALEVHGIAGHGEAEDPEEQAHEDVELPDDAVPVRTCRG